LLATALALAIAGAGYGASCEDDRPASTDPATIALAIPRPSPLQKRLARYAAVAARHKLTGLASYYSTSLDGTLTATGAIFRNRKLTAAHLTLPLGTWVEIRSRATKKKVRCLVNDRGPYTWFTIDLSQAAARAIGVDVAEDRTVDVRIIALPGDKPLDLDASRIALAEPEEIENEAPAK